MTLQQVKATVEELRAARSSFDAVALSIESVLKVRGTLRFSQADGINSGSGWGSCCAVVLEAASPSRLLSPDACSSAYRRV